MRKLGFAPHVRTGSGGHHIYIEHPGGHVATVNGSTKHELARLYHGLDIRADGGYAIFAGASDAGQYEFLRQPDPYPFENLPTELRVLLKPENNPIPNSPDRERKPDSSPNGRVPAERLILQTIERAGGGRNNAGFWLAAQLRDNAYSKQEAEQIMLAYADRVPTTNAKGQDGLYSKTEALASLRQAYSRPARKSGTQRSCNPQTSQDGMERTSRLFEVRDSGVFLADSDPDKEPLRICSRLDVPKQTRDDRGEGWGRLLRWLDREGREHTWPMPMSLLAGNGDEYRARLLDGGLEIEPGKNARAFLTTYIQTAFCNSQARCVPKLGWHGNVFVLPDCAIGGPEECDEYIYQSPFEPEHHFNIRGSAEDWKREIGSLCGGNSRLMFATCLAFAAPMLLLSETESGGFHIWGASSLGKSTALMVAGSVCGGGGRNGYVESWRTTTNALETFAELHNDSLACLDEISQVSAIEAVEALYMLANGQGKGRMTKTIGMRRRLSWTILLLSSGEVTLREHAGSVGKHTKAGGEIRLANIPADAGAGMGLFEGLHAFPTAAAFAIYLKEVSKKCYGAPVREFLKHLTQNRPGVDSFVRTFITHFLDDKSLLGCSAEVSRVARRFALAAAGELATNIGLTGWRDGDATRAIESCLKAWIRARGSAGPSDLDAAINQVAAFIESQGASRFQADAASKEKVVNRAGFLKRDHDGNVTHYYILPGVFRREVCEGFEPESVARALLERGFLDPGGKGRLQKKPRIPGLGTVWVYSVKPSILGRGGEDNGDIEDVAQIP